MNQLQIEISSLQCVPSGVVGN